MSLPTDLVLPQPKDYKNYDRPDTYLNDLVFDLQTMYESMAQNINGSFRSSFDIDAAQWLPVLKGTTAAGAFTYVNQTGISLRQGILTEVWGDISWSATTATGNLYVELPYIVSKSTNMPFVGECQASGFAFTTGSYVVINAIPSTYRGEFWDCGSGISTGNQTVPASGRVIFHLKYIGVSDE